MVEGDRSSAEEDEGESEGSQSEREFVSAVAHQAVVDVHLGNGDGQVDADREGSYTSEQAQQDEQAAKELGEGRKVRGPGRESEAGDELRVMLQSTENFVVSVADHDGAEGEAHDEKRKRLQAIEVTHRVPPAERRIDYSTGTQEGSALSKCAKKFLITTGIKLNPTMPERMIA